MRKPTGERSTGVANITLDKRCQRPIVPEPGVLFWLGRPNAPLSPCQSPASPAPTRFALGPARTIVFLLLT